MEDIMKMEDLDGHSAPAIINENKGSLANEIFLV